MKRKRPVAELLTIGDEILKGSTLNTNAQYLGRELTSLGFHVGGQAACPDSEAAIAGNLDAVLPRADLVILTGGLGPTPDDVTREGVAAYFGVPLKFSQIQYNRIVRYFREKRKKVPACVRKEAMFPSNSTPLINRYGIALGFYIPSDQGLVVVLPGVPREQEKMFEHLVKPLLAKRFKGVGRKHLLVTKTIGLSEPEIMQRLGKRFFEQDFEFGIYPYPGEAVIRIHTETGAQKRRIKIFLEKKLGTHVYSFKDESFAETIGAFLRRRRSSVSVAESCTGGGLAAELVKMDGASVYFKGGLVAYDNRVKEICLDVDRRVLREKGAVSPEVARAMASGVRRALESTYALSVTGIAGPAGGSKEKPVGTVYIGLAGPGKNRSWHHRFSGDRGHVQRRSIQKALEHLWRELK